MENEATIKASPKWEGKVSAKLENVTADQIWPLYFDFFNFHKFFPGMERCRGIHGNNSEPGCIRYCSAGPEESPIGWSKERAISFDPLHRTMVYEIVDCSLGLKSYVSTVRIVPDGATGCEIEWSFSVDPVASSSLNDMVAQYGVWLNQTAHNMALSVLPKPN